MIKKITSIAAGVALALSVPVVANAGAIVTGFNDNTIPRNDDRSTGLVDLGFTANFYGVSNTQVYVNNNGNVTFDSDLSSYTPFNLNSTSRQIIAPYFADVDTREAGSAVTYGSGSFGGHTAFGVNWIDVDYYSSSTSHTNRNSFQLLLVDRSDVASGDFDIIFNYDQVMWEAGTASSGDSNGLGGSSARAGYSNGTGDMGTFFELAGSADNGAFLDGGPNALISDSRSSNILGQYIFQARAGGVVVDPVDPDPVDPTDPTGTVPVPSTVFLLMLGAAGIVASRKKNNS